MFNSNIQDLTPAKVWGAYEDSCSFMGSIGLKEQVQKNIDFYEGRQWPAPTKETLGMPRPIIDITAFTVDNKCANISGTPVKLVFTSTQENKAKALNEYTEYWSRKVKFKNKLRKLVRRAAVDCGSCFHLYYERESLKLELIDVRNLHVSDPTADDLQEMDWIIISSRKPLSVVKRMADRGVDLNELKQDTEHLSDPERLEREDTRLCTVLTMYFRHKGEVYFMTVTKSVVINKPRPIAPDLKAAKETELYQAISQKLDEEMPTKEREEETQEKKLPALKAELYPVFYWRFKEKRNCFYGQSLVEPIIPDQKAINTSYGILLLGAQIEATGKTFVKSGALRGQKWTNNPLQLVTDYHPTGQGFYKLPSAQLNLAGLTLVDTLVKYVRFTNNVTEINTGEAYGANASGSAIAQLQSQASQATDTIREDLWEELEEFGRILKQEFTLYFKGTTKKNYKYRERIPDENGILKDIDIQGVFNGDDYAEEENSLFDVQVKAIKGTRSSVSGDIQMLEAMLQAQMLTAVEFIEMYPDDALTEKERLISVLNSHAQDNLTMAQQQLAKAQSENKQMVGVIAQLSDTIKQNRTTMDAAYKILSVEENVKQQAIKEASGRMTAETSLAMAQGEVQRHRAAMDAMAADALQGKISGHQQPTQRFENQNRKSSLAELEEDI